VLIERPPADTVARRTPRWPWIVGVCVLAALTICIVILGAHWPFSRDAITRALQHATSRPVRIGGFRTTWFPPGCIAENVRVVHNNNPEATPLITIDRLVIQGSLTGMFTSPKRLQQVKVVGMRIAIPPKGSKDGTAKFALDSGGKPLEIVKIVADGSVLEFLPAKKGDEPFRLRIDALTLLGVGSGKPWQYRATLTNSKPPGVIRASGEFGPWHPEHPEEIPASGEYTYNDVDLGVFHGISGTLQAKGKFAGPLGRIATEGDVEIPNFHVDHSGSVVPMRVTYRAMVNGTNGETTLDSVETRFFRTRLIARGSVADGARLNLAVPSGRIEDILRLFVAEKQSPLSGAVRLDAQFVWPPGPRKFLEKIRMNVGFGIDDARFRSETTQETIDNLSHGKEDPRTALSDLRGGVVFRDGVAMFRNVSFAVAGATADIRGRYGLIDHRVELHGVLRTTGKLSDTTSGFKAFVLKAITPFFKKKENVKVVPFKITGTFQDAKASLDF
jgi:hypothetical protein